MIAHVPLAIFTSVTVMMSNGHWSNVHWSNGRLGRRMASRNVRNGRSRRRRRSSREPQHDNTGRTGVCADAPGRGRRGHDGPLAHTCSAAAAARISEAASPPRSKHAARTEGHGPHEHGPLNSGILHPPPLEEVPSASVGTGAESVASGVPGLRCGGLPACAYRRTQIRGPGGARGWRAWRASNVAPQSSPI